MKNRQSIVIPISTPIATPIFQPVLGGGGSNTVLPLNLTAAALNTTTPFSANYKTATGNIVVRIAARNLGALPNLAATWNGVAMTRVNCPNLTAGPGAFFGVAFVIRAGATGTRALAITAAAGSLADVCIRVGDLSVLPADWQGTVVGYGVTPGFAADEVDAFISPVSQGNNVVAAIIGWPDSRAFEIQGNPGEDLEVNQWSVAFGNSAALFGYDSNVSGEPLYVFFANDRLAQSGGMMLFELKGASV